MKTLRILGLAVAFLLPAAALASPTLGACCPGMACCPGCPLCGHGG